MTRRWFLKGLGAVAVALSVALPTFAASHYWCERYTVEPGPKMAVRYLDGEMRLTSTVRLKCECGDSDERRSPAPWGGVTAETKSLWSVLERHPLPPAQRRNVVWLPA